MRGTENKTKQKTNVMKQKIEKKQKNSFHFTISSDVVEHVEHVEHVNLD